MRIPVIFGIICTFASFATAQDLHYSQVNLNPLHYNPAQTGMYKGNWRVSGLYRGQWESVPVSYRSFAGAFDAKVFRFGSNALSAGFLLQNDQSGDAGLRWTQVGLLASAAHRLGKSNVLSAGFGLTFVQRKFDISKLSFKNQWDGDMFVASLPSGENFGRTSNMTPSLSAGLNWRWEADNEPRTTLSAGLGILHLNRPDINFDQNAVYTLPFRLTAGVEGGATLNEVSDLFAFTLYQQMGANRELIAGAGIRYWMDEAAVRLTLGWRTADALIPAVQVEWGSWTAGVSYDWNLSAFDVATRHRGGFEVGATYISKPVAPVKKRKVCPIF